jgi:uncharacterized protein (DUF427 family)
MDARIGVNENACGGEALGAVTGDGIVVVEVTMLAGVELDRSTIFYAGQCCHPRQSSRSCLARGLRHRDVRRGVVADTRNALTLREAAYPLVQYIPDEDVDFPNWNRRTTLPTVLYKGDCSYYSIAAGGEKSVNAVWSYEDPFPAVVQIRGYVAFYPERVDEIAEQLPT